MSMNRVCPNCFQVESSRYNFGDNRKAEREFHSEKWCDCKYNSPEEMMKDQDMGFKDPKWIAIAKDFIGKYHSSINEGYISNNEELVRFFLKLLKSSANNYHKSISLVERNEDEEWEYIYNGERAHKPKTNILKTTSFPGLKFNITPKPKKTTQKRNILVPILISLALGIILGALVF